MINETQLNYLAVINQCLGGPIRASLPDGADTHLLDCVYALSTRLLVDLRLGDELDKALQRSLREQTDPLRNLLAGSEAGQRLLNEIEALTATDGDVSKAESIAARATVFLMQAGTPEATQMARFVIAAAAENSQRLQLANDSAVAAAATQTDLGTEGITPEEGNRLLSLLREQHNEPRELSIEAVRPVAGGYSKQTIILTLDGNVHVPRQIVIRRDRAESPVGSSVIHEFPLLELLHDLGVKSPKPWLVDAGSVMGSPMLVVSKLPGHTIGGLYSIEEKDKRYAFGLAEEMAKLHMIPLSRLAPDMPGMAIANADFMRAELETTFIKWNDTGEASVAIDAAYEWLRSHLDWADGPRALVHRDLRFHNILCDDGRVTGLLDWELAMVGHPARDLGWVYHHVVQITEWDKFLDHYLSAGGVDCSSRSIAFYSLWAEWFTAVLLYQARAAFASGQASILYAYAGEELRQRSILSVAQRLEQIMVAGRL